MLDQNTDRMWFVIGALVVGAGIILLANKTMPEVFANITKTFKDTTDSATSAIADMTIYQATDGINRVDKYKSNVAIYWRNGEEDASDPYWYEGDVLVDFIAVKPGEKYKVWINPLDPSVYANTFRGGLYYNKDKEYIGSYYKQDINKVIVPNAKASYTYPDPPNKVTDRTPAYVRFAFDGLLKEIDLDVNDLDIRVEKYTDQ